jgi:hypothetical protein
MVPYTTNEGWRIPQSLQSMMPFIQLVLVWFLPESPRWLCSKDRADEALKVLVKYHAAGDPHDRFVMSEFHEIQETIRLEKVNTRNGWQMFLKTPGNRKRLLLIALTAFFSQCSGNGLVSYYLHSILDSIGITRSYDQSLINGGLTIWSFLVSLTAAFFVDKLGRRPLFLTAAVGMLIVFSVWTGCSAVYAESGNTSAGKAVLGMLFVYNFVNGLAWPGLTVAYPVEILPFNIRAKGLALLYACKAAASIFNQYGEFLSYSTSSKKKSNVLFAHWRPCSESNRSGASVLEILFRIHWYPDLRSLRDLLPLRRNQGTHLGGNRTSL